MNESTSQSPLYYRILGSRMLTGSRLDSIRSDLSRIYRKLLLDVDVNEERQEDDQSDTRAVVSFSSNVYDFDRQSQKGIINITRKNNLSIQTIVQ